MSKSSHRVDATRRRRILRDVAAECGTPCFVYFWDDIRTRIATLRDCFGDRFRISYAVKCNPNPVLLERLRDEVELLDVSSLGEVERAVAAGWSGAALSFTGPAKQRHELAASLDLAAGEIILESVDEAVLLNELAEAKRIRQKVLIRISPAKVPRGFALNMSGKPTQFGIDEECLDESLRQIVALPHLEIAGLHIYCGTQCLDAAAIAESYQLFIDLFRRVCSDHDIAPAKLIFGSGLGIPHYAEESPLDLDGLAARVNPTLDALRSEAAFAATDFVLETGRFLVGEAGVYLTRIVRLKHSRNVEIGICDGGMNHHSAATGHFGSVLQRNYRIFALNDSGDADAEYNLVGPLCTTIDTLARKVKLPRLAAGDVVAVEPSGSYGATASPIHFISHPAPIEVLVESDDGGGCTFHDVSQFAGTRVARGATP